MTIQEKIEAKTEQMKEKNKNKKPATRKQKVIASILIPVAGVLVAAAIASPNNNHRETTPPPPADTSHHASTEKKGDVKFNGDSPSIEKAVDEIGRMSQNVDMTPIAKVDRIKELAKSVTCSAQLLDTYTGSMVLVIRDARLQNDDFDELAQLLMIFKGAVVAEKMDGTTTGDFADDYFEVTSSLFQNKNTINSDYIQNKLYEMEKVLPNIEY
jgi:hypothetical protein